MAEQLSKKLLALWHILPYPAHGRLVDLLFILNIQLVGWYHLDQLIDRQQEELIALDHVDKVVLQIFVGDAQQLHAVVCVSEGSDAEAIWGVELWVEELGTVVLDLLELWI